jgi:hypothetical protein
LLISCATPAASVPTEAILSASRSCISSRRASVTSRMTPTRNSSPPVPVKGPFVVTMMRVLPSLPVNTSSFSFGWPEWKTSSSFLQKTSAWWAGTKS